MEKHASDEPTSEIFGANDGLRVERVVKVYGERSTWSQVQQADDALSVVKTFYCKLVMCVW